MTATGKLGQPDKNAPLDDDYMLYTYKVIPCTRVSTHNWKLCRGKHEGEVAARRRHPSCHQADLCAYVNANKQCPMGDSCPYAHNAFESWLHPDRYKTTLCSYAGACTRKFCFFAHSAAELRAPSKQFNSSSQPHVQLAKTVSLETNGSVGTPNSSMSHNSSSSIMHMQGLRVPCWSGSPSAAAAASPGSASSLQSINSQHSSAFHSGSLYSLGSGPNGATPAAAAGGGSSGCSPTSNHSMYGSYAPGLQQQQQHRLAMSVAAADVSCPAPPAVQFTSLIVSAPTLAVATAPAEEAAAAAPHLQQQQQQQQQQPQQLQCWAYNVPIAAAGPGPVPVDSHALQEAPASLASCVQQQQNRDALQQLQLMLQQQEQQQQQQQQLLMQQQQQWNWTQQQQLFTFNPLALQDPAVADMLSAAAMQQSGMATNNSSDAGHLSMPGGQQLQLSAARGWGDLTQQHQQHNLQPACLQASFGNVPVAGGLSSSFPLIMTAAGGGAGRDPAQLQQQLDMLRFAVTQTA